MRPMGMAGQAFADADRTLIARCRVRRRAGVEPVMLPTPCGRHPDQPVGSGPRRMPPAVPVCGSWEGKGRTVVLRKRSSSRKARCGSSSLGVPISLLWPDQTLYPLLAATVANLTLVATKTGMMSHGHPPPINQRIDRTGAAGALEALAVSDLAQ